MRSEGKRASKDKIIKEYTEIFHRNFSSYTLDSTQFVFIDTDAD